MIKLTELTINNVLYGEEGYVVVKSIDSITDKLLCSNIETNILKEYDTKSLSYVVLDSTWLKRFRFSYGFKRNRQTIYTDGWFSPMIKGRNDKMYKLSINQDEDDFTFALDAEIKITLNYVHQLQNLYKSLTKREIPFLANDNKSFVKLV